MNEGQLFIGARFGLRSKPVQSHLVVGEGGVLRIGDDVHVAQGAAISCQSRIDIANGVALGAFCMVMDSDFHVAGSSDVLPDPKPIVIERGARVGHRVVVLPGARIGEGAVVLAGSVVSGEVAPFAVVEGNPARARVFSSAQTGDDPSSVVPRLVQEVLGLSSLPSASDGPDQIREWDSLGALRLIFALEEQFSISLSEDEIKTARSVGDVVRCVESARARRDTHAT